MSSPFLCRVQLIAAAVLFSTGGAAIKATQFSNWQVAGFRSGIAAAAVVLLAPEARRNWSWRPVMVGLAYASMLVLFVTANKLTTAANAIFLHSTAPLYLVLLGPWLLREKLRRADLITLVAMGAGMALFFVAEEAPRHTAPDPMRGNIIGAFAGLSWALTLTGLRWLARREAGEDAGMATVVAGNLTAFLLCLPAALPAGPASTSDWLVVSYLGVFQIGLAYVLLTRGVRGVPALEVSLLLMAEPALNPLWAFLMHGERPSGMALGGAGLIFSAMLARMFSARR